MVGKCFDFHTFLAFRRYCSSQFMQESISRKIWVVGKCSFIHQIVQFPQIWCLQNFVKPWAWLLIHPKSISRKIWVAGKLFNFPTAFKISSKRGGGWFLILPKSISRKNLSGRKIVQFPKCDVALKISSKREGGCWFLIHPKMISRKIWVSVKRLYFPLWHWALISRNSWYFHLFHHCL